MIWYVLENEDKRKYLSSRVTQDILIEKGWGNGYVAVPPTHPLHLGNITQEKISLVQSLDVNGGGSFTQQLTFPTSSNASFTMNAVHQSGLKLNLKEEPQLKLKCPVTHKT